MRTISWGLSGSFISCQRPLHRQMSGAIKHPGERPGCLGKHSILFRLRRIGELCLGTSDVNDITMIDQLVNWPWRRIALRP
ncbi:hypothetical protein QFZ34_001136 [Phyllobacterium ifriqiyense]|uniref:Transposase n=1 Tax=Phyllobacterium ifriqiyense TaxID=314238 RepID=A0ABU0S5C7_9HYPH|nr:hypothetical protein [Phyllobacterium ifriqiyense]MDQ0995959.1 hypothetical protein [Phyllobacterium ifriqiyense]